MPQLFKQKEATLLTRYASNKSCLALTAAVRAFKDAREGTELVSGASDAELRTAKSGRPSVLCGDRPRLRAPTSSCPERHKTPLEP